MSLKRWPWSQGEPSQWTGSTRRGDVIWKCGPGSVAFSRDLESAGLRSRPGQRPPAHCPLTTSVLASAPQDSRHMVSKGRAWRRVKGPSDWEVRR